MPVFSASSRQRRRGFLALAWAAVALLGVSATLVEGQQKGGLLRIGTSGTLTTEKGGKEKAALDTLKSFIKEETGFDNEIVRQKSWRELADKMASGEIQVGVFQGYEFAWAEGSHHGLKPLTVAVNVYRYPVAYVVAQRTNPAKDFAGLQGQSISLPDEGSGFLRLFVDHEVQATGKKRDAFFAKIVPYENVEEAVDDVVDGKVEATAADRAALEAYKRRKPGRFGKLKQVARSQPFPPAVIAYYGTYLSEATRQRFLRGLLNAGKTDRGQTILTMFRITGFETVPDDFEQVVEATRKAYPPTLAAAP